MQTFLPYPNFQQSAACLDYRRLGKQRVEAKQIILCMEKSRDNSLSSLLAPPIAWNNHPAVNMWRKYPEALARYGFDICMEWIGRGYNDSLLTFFSMRFSPSAIITVPAWFGDYNFHASHRANLLRKDPKYYGKFGWTEDPSLPYVWPQNK